MFIILNNVRIRTKLIRLINIDIYLTVSHSQIYANVVEAEKEQNLSLFPVYYIHSNIVEASII